MGILPPIDPVMDSDFPDLLSSLFPIDPVMNSDFPDLLELQYPINLGMEPDVLYSDVLDWPPPSPIDFVVPDIQETPIDPVMDSDFPGPYSIDHVLVAPDREWEYYPRQTAVLAPVTPSVGEKRPHPCFPVTMMLVQFRRLGRRQPWIPFGFTNSSAACKIGKCRKFEIILTEGQLPHWPKERRLIASIAADDGDRSEFSLSCVDKGATKSEKLSISLRLQELMEFYLSVHPRRDTTNGNKRSHTLSIDYVHKERRVPLIQFGGMYSAGHKHETGRRQRAIYNAARDDETFPEFEISFASEEND